MIETQRLLLRRMEPTDFEGFKAYYCDPELNGVMAGVLHRDELSVRLLFNANMENSYCYGVTLKETGEIIGEVHFGNIVSGYLAHLGFVINKDYRKNGYAFEAVTAFVRYGVESFGFGRIRAMCLLQNTASRKLLEKCGFECEALIYEADFGGAVGDVYYYSLSAF